MIVLQQKNVRNRKDKCEGVHHYMVYLFSNNTCAVMCTHSIIAFLNHDTAKSVVDPGIYLGGLEALEIVIVMAHFVQRFLPAGASSALAGSMII